MWKHSVKHRDIALIQAQPHAARLINRRQREFMVLAVVLRQAALRVVPREGSVAPFSSVDASSGMIIVTKLRGNDFHEM